MSIKLIGKIVSSVAAFVLTAGCDFYEARNYQEGLLKALVEKTALNASEFIEQPQELNGLARAVAASPQFDPQPVQRALSAFLGSPDESDLRAGVLTYKNDQLNPAALGSCQALPCELLKAATLDPSAVDGSTLLEQLPKGARLTVKGKTVNALIVWQGSEQEASLEVESNGGKTLTGPQKVLLDWQQQKGNIGMRINGQQASWKTAQEQLKQNIPAKLSLSSSNKETQVGNRGGPLLVINIVDSKIEQTVARHQQSRQPETTDDPLREAQQKLRETEKERDELQEDLDQRQADLGKTQKERDEIRDERDRLRVRGGDRQGVGNAGNNNNNENARQPADVGNADQADGVPQNNAPRRQQARAANVNPAPRQQQNQNNNEDARNQPPPVNDNVINNPIDRRQAAAMFEDALHRAQGNQPGPRRRRGNRRRADRNVVVVPDPPPEDEEQYAGIEAGLRFGRELQAINELIKTGCEIKNFTQLSRDKKTLETALTLSEGIANYGDDDEFDIVLNAFLQRDGNAEDFTQAQKNAMEALAGQNNQDQDQRTGLYKLIGLYPNRQRNNNNQVNHRNAAPAPMPGAPMPPLAPGAAPAPVLLPIPPNAADRAQRKVDAAVEIRRALEQVLMAERDNQATPQLRKNEINDAITAARAKIPNRERRRVRRGNAGGNRNGDNGQGGEEQQRQENLKTVLALGKHFCLIYPIVNGNLQDDEKVAVMRRYKQLYMARHGWLNQQYAALRNRRNDAEQTLDDWLRNNGHPQGVGENVNGRTIAQRLENGEPGLRQLAEAGFVDVFDQNFRERFSQAARACVNFNQTVAVAVSQELKLIYRAIVGENFDVNNDEENEVNDPWNDIQEYLNGKNGNPAMTAEININRYAREVFMGQNIILVDDNNIQRCLDLAFGAGD